MSQPLPSLEDLADWYHTSLGQRIASTIGEQLDALLPSMFGYHLLLVGLDKPEWLQSSVIRHQVMMTDWFSKNVSLQGEYSRLPFAADSLDVVILPHSLELCEQPLQLLDDVDHALVPEGHVIIIGFNPYSLWGWRRYFGNKEQAPWRGSFLSPMKIRKQLLQLGYEVQAIHHGFYRPPIDNDEWLKRLLFLETFGRLALPYTAGVYVMVAKKKVANLMHIRPIWGYKGFVLGKRYSDRVVGAKMEEND